MKKSDRTRTLIITESAKIMGRKGVERTSISDIIATTGLSKGAIYGNFKNKEEIALEAYKHLVVGAAERSLESTLKGNTAFEMFDYLLKFYLSDLNPNSGCQLLNFGLECDNTETAIKQLLTSSIKRSQRLIETIINSGIERGEIKSDLNVHAFSILAFSAIEGAALCARTANDRAWMTVVLDFLKAELRKYKI